MKDQYRVEAFVYGDAVPERLHEIFERYDRMTYSRWLERASKTTVYNASDLKDDVVKHAPKFGIASDDPDAFVQQAIETIRTGEAYYAKVWAGTQIQLEFWRGNDQVVVDRRLQIRGFFRAPSVNIAEKIERHRLWLITRGIR